MEHFWVLFAALCAFVINSDYLQRLALWGETCKQRARFCGPSDPTENIPGNPGVENSVFIKGFAMEAAHIFAPPIFFKNPLTDAPLPHPPKATHTSTGINAQN